MVSSRSLSHVAVFLLASSGLLFLLAPLAMPTDYSWVSNSISESGAQKLTGAWVTRLGFLSFGLGVILATVVNWTIWKPAGAWLLSGFGFLMLTVAAFSTKQWGSYVPFNELENTLHSVSASVMGFFYGIGVLLVILAEKNVSRAMKILGWVAVLTSIAMPILSGVVPEFGGVFQRLMFAIAITWFIVQVVRVRNDSRS
jgi:hypothetical protein